VACAEEGEAAHIVSGDRDLLSLSRRRGIEVLTPRQFLEIIAE
jgi:predicted nucleic acid-binding protein